MDHRLVVTAAFASLLATGLLAPAAAQEAGNDRESREKEKCYGIAKAGTNDCANISESHSCAGQAKVSDSLDEWVYVGKGSCARMGGKSFEEAKSLLERKPR